MSMNEKNLGGWVGFLKIFHTLLLHQPLQKECVLWLDMRTFNYESLFKIGPNKLILCLASAPALDLPHFFTKQTRICRQNPEIRRCSVILLAPRSISSERLNESEF
jgi:hypothetical protein